MGEGSKQVRVDNWGIFFLQRLQMFFNKTDYCDLTLQFEGNVQLKVHRLVMNACTDYFQVLEQTCEMIDDVLIMPSDLQADVVLPIVNFMYTGMLEFHMSIFDKLYKTANLMNITVLTKLLDAQKIPIAPLPRSLKRNATVPHTWNLQGKKISAKTADYDLPATLPGRKLPVWKRKSAPIGIPHTIVPHYFPEQKRTVSQLDPLASFDNAPKPTRFEWPDEDVSSLNVFGATFDDISYTSKPLVTQDEEPKPSTSFDRLKETPDLTPQSSSYINSSIDMDDVKDYVREQKIRMNLAEEDDEDAQDDIDNFNKSDSQKRKAKFEVVSSKRVRFNVNEKENHIRQGKINITPTGKGGGSDVYHTKIISEVLKKYPNLVKKNKNIRLKILPKSNTPISLEQMKKTTLKKIQQIKLNPITASPVSSRPMRLIEEHNEEEGPWKCQRCSTLADPVEFVLYYLYRKHMTDVHNEKFDPHMCKFCGHKSDKPNLLMYHQYTKHGVKPPASYNFPKCPQCPYIALTGTLLARHKMNHTKYELQCNQCKITFTNQAALTSHSQITGHNGKSEKLSYDCQYCTKKVTSGSLLFSHIRMLHRDEARRDGIVSIDELEDNNDDSDQDEQSEDSDEYITPEIVQDKREKIKILSNVKLPSVDASNPLQQNVATLEPSSEAEALNNVATGIATSLGLVDVVVLDENQQYILHSDNQDNIASSESEFILPDMQDTPTYTSAQQVITSEQNVITQSMLHTSDIGSTDELVMVLTDHDYGDANSEMVNNDNSNIVVLYSHPIEGQENQFITSQGNLMLTSQAGLIELRNGNSIVTTTAPHFINSSRNADNSHIESIEMIQQEINQHPHANRQVHLEPNEKHELEQSTTPVPVDSDFTKLENENNVQTIAEQEENSEQINFNTLEDIIIVDSNNERVEENIDRQESASASDVEEVQPLETINSSSTIIENEKQLNTYQNASAESENSQQEPTNKDYEQTEGSIVINSELLAENNEETLNATEESTEKTSQEEVMSETTNNTAQSTDFILNLPQEETTCNEECTIIEDVSKNDTNGIELECSAEDLNSGLEELDTTVGELNTPVEETNDTTREEVNNQIEELNIESEELNETDEAHQSDHIITIETSKSLDQDPLQIEPSDNGEIPIGDEAAINETETYEVEQDITEAINISDENLPSDNREELTDQNSELPNCNSPHENLNLPEEDSQQELDNNGDLQSANDNSPVQVANALVDNNDAMQNEVSHLSSNGGQTSPILLPSTSNKPSYSRNNSNQSAKIILEDWEDTDSQQSDSKHGAVHKLIDDWDDDEEEKKSVT